MKKREFIYIAVLTLLIAFMDMTGIPSAFFVHIQVADIEPVYFTLMVNFLFIGVAAYLFLRTLCPAWDLGFRKKGLVDGLKKYGIIGALVAAVGFLAFYVGLSPFDRQPVCALPYCFSSINGYADLTLYIVVPVYIILGIYSFIELKKEA